MSPRVREDSVHPRLQSGRIGRVRRASFDVSAACGIVRPLNFTVRPPMKRITLAFVVLVVAVVPLLPAAADGGTPVMKVAVYADGRVVADGHEISISALRDALHETQQCPWERSVLP